MAGQGEDLFGHFRAAMTGPARQSVASMGEAKPGKARSGKAMRAEFSRKVRAAVFLRAAGCCEGCGARLKVGEGEIDHVLPDALGGEPTIDNARLLCRVCHAGKTADDVRRIRKADRQRDRHTGAMQSKRPMPGSKASGWKRKMDGTWERR